MDVVVGGRDVLVAEPVADADEVARALGELGREAVPKVVRADLGGAFGVEACGKRGFPKRVTSVELREDRALFGARRIKGGPGAI